MNKRISISGFAWAGGNNLPNYSFYCEEGHETVVNLPWDARGDTTECESCGQPAEYKISAPNITRASFVDGTKRAGFSEGREALKIQREAKSHADRKEIAAEIKKMGVKVSKGPL